MRFPGKIFCFAVQAVGFAEKCGIEILPIIGQLAFFNQSGLVVGQKGVLGLPGLDRIVIRSLHTA